MMVSAIWYHLYNLKNVKNTHEEVILLVNMQLQSYHSSMCVFHVILTIQMVPNRANSTKSSCIVNITSREVTVQSTLQGQLNNILFGSVFTDDLEQVFPYWL